MRRWYLLLFIILTVQSGFACARSESARAVRPAPQLRGLSSDEASLLIATLEDAQRRLRRGEFQTFELLTGAIASYDAIKVSPRDAFLGVPFKQLWGIERTAVADQHWHAFKLAYMPNGADQLYWDIEVTMGDGKLERVRMIYRPPAPF